VSKTINLPAPDAWHAHLRFGDMLSAVTEWSARQFRRLVAMGNVPAVEDLQQAMDYDDECNQEAEKFGCQVLVSPKLTLNTTPQMVCNFCHAGFTRLKLYAGVTTGSKNGVANFEALYPCLETMRDLGMYLQIHAEDPDPRVDCDQRERSCLSKVAKLVNDFPQLHVIIEHISCKETVDFMSRMHEQNRPVAATVTLAHLKHNKNDVRGDLLDPQLIMKPEIQGFADHAAIQQLVYESCLPNVFFGSDSAPHPASNKGPIKVANGGFTAPVLMPELTRLFLMHANRDRLISFTSHFGADYYDFPRNTSTLVLEEQEWTVPELVGTVRPYMAGEKLGLKVAGIV